jgi:hypothetical protein
MAQGLLDNGQQPEIAGYYRTTTYPNSQIPVHQVQLPELYHRNIVTQVSGAAVAWNRVRRLRGIQIVHFKDYLHAAIFARFAVSRILTGRQSPFIAGRHEPAPDDAGALSPTAQSSATGGFTAEPAHCVCRLFRWVLIPACSVLSLKRGGS